MKARQPRSGSWIRSVRRSPSDSGAPGVTRVLRRNSFTEPRVAQVAAFGLPQRERTRGHVSAPRDVPRGPRDPRPVSVHMAMTTETVHSRTALLQEKIMTISQTARKHLVALAITAGALVGLSAVAAEAQQSRELFNNSNIYGVGNGISGQPTFSLGQAT